MSERPLRSVQLQDVGPRVRVRFGLSAEQEEFRGSARGSVPEPVEFLALVDTGASVTVVPPGTFARPGIRSTERMRIRSGLGNGEEHDSSVGRLHFDDGRGTMSMPTHAIEGVHPGRFTGIVGRETLAHGRFLYEGREGVSGLVLRGTEIPLVDPATE